MPMPGDGAPHAAPHTAPRAGLAAAILRFPLTRLLLSVAMMVLPALAAHKAVSGLGLARTPQYVCAALAAALCGWAGYLAYVRLVERRTATEFGTHGALRELAAGALLGSALFAGTVAVLAALGVFRITGSGPWSNLLAPLAAAVMAAVLEEILFRAILFRIAEESLGTWLALLLSGTLFGIIHMISPQATWLGAVSIIFEAGILLAAAYMLTRRLWLPIGLHAAWNFTQGGLFGIAVSGTPSKGLLQGTLTGPEWLSGGRFGAEASIVAVLLCMGAAAVLLAAAVRRRGVRPPRWRRGAAAVA
jgi:membrane protease YdiL (CAAX protease family)